jgi:2,3-bisphosphoglycerate-independent phosphoglycerate mutase
MEKVVLIITDGIGKSSEKKWNAFEHAKKPTYDFLFKNIPFGIVKTHGLSVGLPNGQMGNSEVGHMTIGGGRIFYQDFVKINKAIENNTLKDNQILKNALQPKRIHLIGLVSDGGVHSHISHLFYLIDIAIKNQNQIFIHIITDGRDVSPISAKNYVQEILNKYKNNSLVQIASISGRFYTMDRDKRWDRIEKGFNAIVKNYPITNLNPIDYIEDSYKKGENDEFISPIAFQKYQGAKNGDSFIFYNFRSDRMREIVETIGKNREFLITTLTEYNENFTFPVIFKKEIPQNGLSETIAKANLIQFHIAETEKYAHVTFFFNGGIDKPFKNEHRILIPSPKVKTYDLKPEMNANQVTDEVLVAMDKNFDFIVVNYANGDMVGHTGVFKAGIKAVETIDKEIGRIINKSKKLNYAIVITSDHGNCEKMRDENNNILTNHTVGDVWFFVLSKKVKKVLNGGLNNIAPTILKLMDLEIPKEMDKPLI